MTLALDFDGVIHWYRQGWLDGTIYDPPMPGAVESVQSLMGYDACFVHTSRPALEVTRWLTGHGLPATNDDRCRTCVRHGASPACPHCHGSGLLTFWEHREELLVTNRKLPAVAYLDDRGIRFTDWDSAMALLGEALGRQLRPDAEPL